jgi:uncharacterized protein YcbX
METSSSLALSSDNNLWLAAGAAVAVAAVTSQYRRIADGASSLLHKAYLHAVVARRTPPSAAGTVTQLNIHPGEFSRGRRTDTIVQDGSFFLKFLHCSSAAAAVKSLRAVAVEEAVLVERGFEGDRAFMLVTPAPTPLLGSFRPEDATHRFLTQRTCPTLATVSAALSSSKAADPATTLTLSSDRMPGKLVTLSARPEASAPIYRAAVWGDVVRVQDMGDRAAEFFTELVALDPSVPDELKTQVRLVVQTPDDGRSTDPRFTPASARSVVSNSNPKVSLTDGFPLLIACQASLDELNRRLREKNKPELPMARFRPNIVISNSEPFEEDRWKVIRVGGSILHVVKPCPRCKQSCTDQLTGAVTDEPLATLYDFRALDPKNVANVYFCQNALAAPGSAGASIRVGDKVEVLERGEPVYTD